MNLEKQYKNISLTQFLEQMDRNDFVWIIKRLSGNDTGLTGGHQVGMYVPSSFIKAVMPEVCTTERLNPDKFFDCYIASNDCPQAGVRAIYYNNRFFGGTRNEFRITRWAGTPLQDEENTGSICILGCQRVGDDVNALSWVAKTKEEELLIENWLGEEVEPGRQYISTEMKQRKVNENVLDLLPKEWYDTFPSGKDIFKFIECRLPQIQWKKTVDELLLARRALEFEVFAEVERQNVLPNIRDGFSTVDDFIRYSNSVANRRKSRAGTSLELHLESIFNYEKLKFEAQAVTELNKKPDFLFPSGIAYHDATYPETKLHMLASKTCCKDRWRQVINEADRIKQKHLFTLQEGVSGNQLKEMYKEGIVLVVPQPILKSFPKDYHNQILTLTGFINFIRIGQ